MRRQHRKDGYQFLSGLNLGNTGLVVAVAGILLTLFLMSNILPLVDEPENREFCAMVRILYDLDERKKFTRPGPAHNTAMDSTLSWIPYQGNGGAYKHNNVHIPVDVNGGITSSVRHLQINIKEHITELLNPGSRTLVADKPLFVWLLDALGQDLGEFNCKTINEPQTLAMLISSAISSEGAEAVEVFAIGDGEALLLKRVYAEGPRLELLFQDLDHPDNGLVAVQLAAPQSEGLVRNIVAGWPRSGGR